MKFRNMSWKAIICFSPNFWVINEDFYQSLSDEQREALDSSIEEAAAYNWDISIDVTMMPRPTLSPPETLRLLFLMIHLSSRCEMP